MDFLLSLCRCVAHDCLNLGHCRLAYYFGHISQYCANPAVLNKHVPMYIYLVIMTIFVVHINLCFTILIFNIDVVGNRL